MKVYEVECRAIITLAAKDMQQAALHGAAVIRDRPHLIYVRAVHERNFEAAGKIFESSKSPRTHQSDITVSVAERSS
jgi:hypothetical protein